MAKEVVKQKEVKVDSCPYCNSVGKKSECAEQIGGRFQCGTCGKHWRKEDLAKEYSIELERGDKWAREHKARQLSGV